MMKKIKSIAIFILQLVVLAVIAFGLVRLVHQFVFQPYYVYGSSMEPNFFNFDYLIIDKVSYLAGEPKRGEAVVLISPLDQRSKFLKRVIGLPGEEIKIKEGKIYLKTNSASWQELEEPYLQKGLSTPGEIDVSLKEDEYFVLGDNRGSSLDSRSFGPVKERAILGRICLRLWPFDRLTVIRAAQ